MFQINISSPQRAAIESKRAKEQKSWLDFRAEPSSLSGALNVCENEKQSRLSGEIAGGAILSDFT